MKRLTIIFAVLLTATSIMAEEFKIGKLTFEIATPTTVELTDADNDITKVFLSDTIIYKGNSYTLTYIGYEAFLGCSSLSSITIPENVTSIREYAFCDCSALTSVTIPNSVTSIGDRAFWGCTSLTSVTIPNSVTSIGYYAFEGTALYETPANWESGALYIDDCLIKVDEGFAGHFRIKENTRVISEYAFSGCESLKSVTIPNSVTSIKIWAFAGCKSLKSVTILNSLTSIEVEAFSGCKSLKYVVIPNIITNIEGSAFPKHTKIIRE